MSDDLFWVAGSYGNVTTARVKAPIFVMRQWRIDMEIYIEFDEIDYWMPGAATAWRKAAPNVKQGSSDETVADHARADYLYRHAISTAFTVYRRLLDLGVCKEQARAVLPLATFTQCIMKLDGAETHTLERWEERRLLLSACTNVRFVVHYLYEHFYLHTYHLLQSAVR